MRNILQATDSLKLPNAEIFEQPQQDQPALVKVVMQRWINNRPWFTD
jgi:hypothetical protein